MQYISCKQRGGGDSNSELNYGTNSHFFHDLGTVYHQFDSMACPQRDSEKQNIVFKFFSKIIGSQSDDIYIPDHESMQSFALEVYLEEFKQALQDCRIKDIEQATKFALQVFNALNRPETINDSGSISAWQCQKLSEVCTC